MCQRMFKLCLVGIILCLPFLTYAIDLDNMRGHRYCEIILSKQKLTFAVYNTLRLNDCPEALWNKITVAQIKQKTGSYFVHLNGPRYTLMDQIKNAALINPEQRVFGGIAMREAGILHLGIMDLLRAPKPYREHVVDRQTTWVYQAGRPVYELIDPKGQVFVMQSYSVQLTPQTVDSLSTLGKRLTLPNGWRFRTGVLTNDEAVVAIHNKAVVVQDELMNTYQLATHDLLPA
ncbi:hypothetical protein N9Q05_02595 [bacterium]|nr:hypothetical protein [bacterium]